MNKEKSTKAGTIIAIIVAALFLALIFALAIDFNPMLVLLSLLHFLHFGDNGKLCFYSQRQYPEAYAYGI